MTALSEVDRGAKDSTDIETWRLDGLVDDLLTRRGLMTCFRNDIGALTQSLQAYGEWAEHEIAFCRRFIETGDTVLDVGAYIGTHSLAFAEFVGPTGCVLGFEAQPASFALLAHNLAAQRATQITAVNAVVSSPDAGATVPLNRIDIAAPRSFGSAAIAMHGDHPPSPVPVITLDSLQLTSCGLIKIDVEGMEDQVLRGAERLLSSCAPLVYAECNAVENGSRVVACLRASGYDVWMYLADAFNPLNWRANSTNIFGNSKEVALVGVPPHRRVLCESLSSTAHESFFKVITLDDLVAGMLLKPQYPREVLQFTTACRAGGRRV